MKYDFDCVIIGSGIAGMTAAIYLKRANLNVLIVEKESPGGLLNKIEKIENYPGYISIKGPDLAYKLYEQVRNLNIEIRYGNLLNIEDHIVKTDVEEISAKTVILAVGRTARKLNGTSNLSNVSYCAVCDANLYKDKVVALVGADDKSIDEAVYLSKICKKVIVMAKDLSELDKNKLEEVSLIKNIELYDDCVIKTLIQEKNMLNKIVTNKNEFEVDGMFISLGYEPNINYLDQIEKVDGYIKVNEKMQTNIDYIYAIGDIIKKDVYQLTTAIGEATVCAINIQKYLKNR